MTAVVVPEFLPQAHLDRLGKRHAVTYDPDLYGRREELFGDLADARAVLVRNRTLIDVELLDHAPQLEVVGRLGVGLDNIDMPAAQAAGVEVVPAFGGNAVSVAEYVLGAILHLTRGTFGMTESMLRGEWPRQGHAFGREIYEQTLGLVGFGAIARHVARRAAGFGMEIIAHDPYVTDGDAWNLARPVGFEEVLSESDVLSVHVPLSDATRNLIDDRAIGRCKLGAIVINTSRGGIVDEKALARALRQGRLGGAALDVFEHEPLDPVHAEAFAGLPNLVLSPHVAGNTRESVDRIATMIVDAVLDRLGRG